MTESLFSEACWLRWSDNNCTVGWTSIHGHFNPEEMEWLEENVPGGHFTNTFYTEYRYWPSSTNHERNFGWQRRGYYYSFPLLENIKFVTLLRLNGLVPNEGDKNREGKLRSGAWLQEQMKHGESV